MKLKFKILFVNSFFLIKILGFLSVFPQVIRTIVLLFSYLSGFVHMPNRQHIREMIANSFFVIQPKGNGTGICELLPIPVKMVLIYSPAQFVVCQ